MDGIAHAVVDWGTSNFRLWTLDRTGRVLGERRSDQGLAACAAEGFEVVLESHLTALGVPDGVPVMMCGMVGSRGGWVEATYLDAPVPLQRLAELATSACAQKREVRILPGLAQRCGKHKDVMRGEETQLLTLATEGWSGTACLPGTHSKWVSLVDGAVSRFSTFMTGELFHLLSTVSMIAPAIEGGAPVDAYSQAFGSGVADGIASPAEVTNLLFELRARWLLCAQAPSDALARLSGLLVGVELAGAKSWSGSIAGTVLIASGTVAALYRRALVIANAPDIVIRDADTCVRNGLHVAARASFPEIRKTFR